MANDVTICITGNLTDDPTLRFTPSGAAVANFTVASTPRSFSKQANEWVDGETMFLNCSVWRQAAENVAESLQKGMRVIAQGRLKARSYQTKDGDKRTVFEVDVEEVGPSLAYATATVRRAGRTAPQQSQQPQRQQPAPDPWAQTHHDQRGQQGGRDPWAGGNNDTPPF